MQNFPMKLGHERKNPMWFSADETAVADDATSGHVRLGAGYRVVTGAVVTAV